MVQPFTAALTHVRPMDNRIRTQEAVIEQLKHAGEDTSQVVARLTLLRSALEEMRLQIARLVPTEEQAAARAAGLVAKQKERVASLIHAGTAGD